QPGKPLLSANGAGQTNMRCEAGGVVAVMHLGAPQTRENLSFIPVDLEVPSIAAPGQSGPSQPALPDQSDRTRSVRFGLIREGDSWKLLTMGLLLLDIPSLAHEWEVADLLSREMAAMEALQKIAKALKAYQQAFGRLPETLEQLGPTNSQGASPDKSGLLDAELAKGESGGYVFRFNIVPPTTEPDETEREKTAGFELAATPIAYGKGGRRS